MTTGDTYVIEGEHLQMGDIVKRCESIARRKKTAYFVGRETIRGRIRCGIRTWEGLTSPVASRKRGADHPWKQGISSKSKARNTGHRVSVDSLYEPEDYVGPDETLDALLKDF